MVAGDGVKESSIGANFVDVIDELAETHKRERHLEDELKHLRWELSHHKQLAAEYRGLKTLLTLIQVPLSSV